MNHSLVRSKSLGMADADGHMNRLRPALTPELHVRRVIYNIVSYAAVVRASRNASWGGNRAGKGIGGFAWHFTKQLRRMDLVVWCLLAVCSDMADKPNIYVDAKSYMKYLNIWFILQASCSVIEKRKRMRRNGRTAEGWGGGERWCDK